MGKNVNSSKAEGKTRGMKKNRKLEIRERKEGTIMLQRGVNGIRVTRGSKRQTRKKQPRNEKKSVKEKQSPRRRDEKTKRKTPTQ